MIDHVAAHILAHAAGATFSPEEAITVLHVMPRHGLVLAAVLSRGFHDYQPSCAVKHGHGLELLPHYSFHVLFDDISATLEAAAARGDMPTIELLWRLAGPTPATSFAWFAPNTGFLGEISVRGHAPVLEWMSHAVGTGMIDWKQLPWGPTARLGQNEAIHWAIAHGHLKDLHRTDAVLSTRNGDSSVMEWWIATNSNGETIRELLDDVISPAFATKSGALKALEWWWANSGSKLPEPTLFARIADMALLCESPALAEWWWARFLEHRTPEHKFGNSRMLKEVTWFKSANNLAWYWQKFHEVRGCFPDTPEDHPQGLRFTFQSQATLPVLQWAVGKSAVLSGKKLKLAHGFFIECARDDRADLLEFALHSADSLDADWPTNILNVAAGHGHLDVLEWVECNQDKLPAQNIICYLSGAARVDAVGVIVWWHSRYPVSKRDWQLVCSEAIKHNSLQVQLWLRDHRDLFAPATDEERRELSDLCIAALSNATLFTLDFFSTMLPDLALPAHPDYAFSSVTTMHWYLHHANATAASLLPLSPSVFGSLLQLGVPNMLEWWLQAHLAAGHQVVLPSIGKLHSYYQHGKGSHSWVGDVTVTRKIPVFVESDLGIVPYSLQ